MSRHTKYIQEMLDKLDSGFNYVKSPDEHVTFKRYNLMLCGKLTTMIAVHHYGTLILTIAYSDALKHVGTNGNSFEIGEFAYSTTDARIINQVLDRYVPGYVAHSRKGEVIVD